MVSKLWQFLFFNKMDTLWTLFLSFDLVYISVARAESLKAVDLMEIGLNSRNPKIKQTTKNKQNGIMFTLTHYFSA